MLFLRRPTAETIQAFLVAQAKHDLTYSAVGTTATTPPAGYVVDHTRIKLGVGEKRFAAAKKALERWQQLLSHGISPLEPGAGQAGPTVTRWRLRVNVPALASEPRA